MTSRKCYIHNLNPIFKPPKNNKRRPFFICYAMERAEEIDVSRCELNYILQAKNIKTGLPLKRFRQLNKHRASAMRAMVSAMLYHFNISSELVQASVEQLSDECGLSTISASGNKSITRASRLITNFMEPMGYVSCKKIWDKILGNYMPKMIKLTPLFFMLLGISEKKLINAKQQQLGWINKNLISKGLNPITMLDAKRRSKDIQMKSIFKYRVSRHAFYKKKKNAQRLISLDEKEARQTILRALVAKYSLSELTKMGPSGLKKQVNISYYYLRKIATNTYPDN
ncbi:MAG: plasmid replication initiator RepA (plasmid) [Buchnera aphidicola (Brevicoryne brassicae)]|uniref:Plasmid replication initiator RepA n=1 Tax=Buchnera aphidicola (Brevicoryne brassicae) TaxID=911343 RepID=A0A4D6Y0K2_9GAMM|nr:plasmid replication initiator RepA [Buchnera aphidicola]QCI20159.1 replication protein RepA [Buchnera aphidicola (Brevicoryne brassicae)]QCI20164.1 replication protein RepA [Buchnera aphidicola (Brevicoryne brassicae)]WAI19260.1 MAG: plasmid replication initiator RepA [Buchnera aphidicola (Brevicoryne brassicae)]